jgi:hypothetical protein
MTTPHFFISQGLFLQLQSTAINGSRSRITYPITYPRPPYCTRDEELDRGICRDDFHLEQHYLGIVPSVEATHVAVNVGSLYYRHGKSTEEKPVIVVVVVVADIVRISAIFSASKVS